MIMVGGLNGWVEGTVRENITGVFGVQVKLRIGKLYGVYWECKL